MAVSSAPWRLWRLTPGSTGTPATSSAPAARGSSPETPVASATEEEDEVEAMSSDLLGPWDLYLFCISIIL